MLGILKILSEVVQNHQEDWRLNSQTMELIGGLNYKTHTGDNCRSDSMGVINNNPNMSNYFRSSANIGVVREACRLIQQKITFSLVMHSQ